MNHLPSIFDHIAPLESGGIIARNGFLFQDHVAVQFCIKMLTDCNLLEVRCESQDDVTLIWDESGIPQIEFVQVKGNELDQLWSVSKICAKEGSKPNPGGHDNRSSKPSILERLFANDRFEEQSRFRIVTRRDINNELSILKNQLSSPARTTGVTEHKNLCAKIQQYHPNFISPKGNAVEYFVSQLCWDVAYETDILAEMNRNALRNYFESKRIYLINSHISTLYLNILQKVQDAACADWNTEPDAKRIINSDFLVWVEDAMRAVKDAVSTSASEVVREKMEDAKLSSADITTALSMLEHYRNDSLSSKYFDSVDRSLIEQEVWAELHELRSKFDSGNVSESNIEFHAKCLLKLRELQTDLPIGFKPTLSFLQGSMYYITGRCGHRFRRLGT